MNKTASNLIFLAVGAAIGAAVTYVATSDRREEWLEEAGKLVSKIKSSLTGVEEEAEVELDELIEDEE